ncbi:hypothetical protein Ahy_B04g072762 [Arachis hypogaea]|uniref:hAT-like transposase RNase-H fold domain-containing protein n=1 Tax=Arachis hypogaea TaxID=3818 RepID=A0A444ZNQ2_ARAHY|nr:hypothetical protein Ahy_B04g072762 [Arachis hypogaea]
MHALQARFKVPSQTTLVRDIGAFYAEEKMKLQDFFSENCGRVCLTTNSWTSIQIFTYDDKSFRRGYRRTIESYLNNWNLNWVFSVTVDNASSNDVAIKYLK